LYDDIMDRAPYSPTRGRPPITWPGGAHIAVWIVPNIEHYEFRPEPNSFYNSYPRVTPPDVQQYSFREFGNRVGFWRLLHVMDEYAVRATASLNIGVLDLFPQISEAMQARQWDYMSHGYYNTRPVFGYTEDEERTELQRACATFRRHLDSQLRGMLGPAVSITPRTFDLMTECGMSYTADVFHDDQPTPIMAEHGRLVSIPYTVDLNDGNLNAAAAMDALAARSRAQFDRLWREGATSGTVMCLALHPYIIGQPQFIGLMREVLDYMMTREGVWWATAAEITDHFLEHSYEEQLDYASSFGRAV
jgi:allantoinase